MSQSLTLWDRYPQCGYHMLIILSRIQTIHLPATNQLPSKLGFLSLQWPFQEPKVEVPTIYKAYFSGLCKGIPPQNMAKNMVLTYLHQLDPEDLPLNI